MGKKINELTAITDAQAADSTRLFANADPSTGIAGSVSMGQLKTAIGVKKVKYVASGAEGTTLSIPSISGKQVFLVTREPVILYEVTASPDPAEYTWNGSVITLGTATTVGERFNVLYANV